MEVPLIVVLLVLALMVGVTAGGVYVVRLRRALRRGCAVRRLTEAAFVRDNEALARRIEVVVRERAVLAEADAVLDSALAVHHRTEGGPL